MFECIYQFSFNLGQMDSFEVVGVPWEAEETLEIQLRHHINNDQKVAQEVISEVCFIIISW